MSNSNCDKNLQEALLLAENLLRLADEGDAHRQDVGCGILYGAVRDSAYRIRALAKTEITTHNSQANASQTQLGQRK